MKSVADSPSASINAPQENLLGDALCFHIKVMRLRPEEGFRDEKSHFRSSFIPLIAALSPCSRHLQAFLVPPALFRFSPVNVRNTFETIRRLETHLWFAGDSWGV